MTEPGNDRTPPAKREKDHPASPDAFAFVEEKLTKMVADYKRKLNYSRRVVNVTKVGSIITGAILTVVIGAKPFFKDDYDLTALSIIALVISAGLTALATWEAFSDHRWKWVRYRATLYTLFRLRDDLLYFQKKGVAISAVQLDAFYELLKETIHETNQEWMSKRGPNIGASVGQSPIVPRQDKTSSQPARFGAEPSPHLASRPSLPQAAVSRRNQLPPSRASPRPVPREAELRPTPVADDGAR